ncbi:hypothetical protein HDV03_000745 [Kappamyces sp. JEL0829]|nr:hypothetical protein HDV03_000745 [Kappamyces sp. JEL0829]
MHPSGARVYGFVWHAAIALASAATLTQSLLEKFDGLAREYQGHEELAGLQWEALLGEDRQRQACIDELGSQSGREQNLDASGRVPANIGSALPLLLRYPGALEAMVVRHTRRMQELTSELEATLAELDQIVVQLGKLEQMASRRAAETATDLHVYPAALSIVHICWWLQDQFEGYTRDVHHKKQVFRQLSKQDLTTLVREWKEPQDFIDYRQQVAMMERLRLSKLLG